MDLPLVVCTGLCVVDIIFTVDRLPESTGKYFATGSTDSVGGPAATAAAAVARLGGRARFVGRSGSDPRADYLRKALLAAGVEAALEEVAGLRSPVSAVLVTPDGERTIVNHADPELFDNGPPAKSYEDAGAVLADVRWPKGAVYAMEHASELGLPGILDLDVIPLAHTSIVRAAVEAASHVIASRPGMTSFTGAGDLRTGLERLSQMTQGWVAVTDGADGVLWVDGHLPAVEVDAKYTLGAGDVFHGAFALALAEGRSEESSLRFGSAAAALKCTRSGGWSALPDRPRVERLMEGTWR